jgi:hypothetical protein
MRAEYRSALLVRPPGADLTPHRSTRSAAERAINPVHTLEGRVSLELNHDFEPKRASTGSICLGA